MENKLGARIKARIKQRGITQEQLADMVGVGQPQISRIIKGDRSTDIEMVKKIALALGESRREYVLLFADLLDDEAGKRQGWIKKVETKLSQLPNDKARQAVENTINIFVPDDPDNKSREKK